MRFPQIQDSIGVSEHLGKAVCPLLGKTRATSKVDGDPQVTEFGIDAPGSAGPIDRLGSGGNLTGVPRVCGELGITHWNSGWVGVTPPWDAVGILCSWGAGVRGVG